MSDTAPLPPEPGTVPDTQLGFFHDVDAEPEPPEDDQVIGDAEQEEGDPDEDDA